MGDVMLYGVLRMPYEMAMSSELSRRQFYSRVQEAASRLEAAEVRLAEIDEALASRPAEVDDEVRAGYVRVPLAPTLEMIEAFSGQLEGACGSYFDWDRGGDEGYKAMIEAAPSHTTNKEKG